MDEPIDDPENLPVNDLPYHTFVSFAKGIGFIPSPIATRQEIENAIEERFRRDKHLHGIESHNWISGIDAILIAQNTGNLEQILGSMVVRPVDYHLFAASFEDKDIPIVYYDLLITAAYNHSIIDLHHLSLNLLEMTNLEYGVGAIVKTCHPACYVFIKLCIRDDISEEMSLNDRMSSIALTKQQIQIALQDINIAYIVTTIANRPENVIAISQIISDEMMDEIDEWYNGLLLSTNTNNESMRILQLATIGFLNVYMRRNVDINGDSYYRHIGKSAELSRSLENLIMIGGSEDPNRPLEPMRKSSSRQRASASTLIDDERMGDGGWCQLFLSTLQWTLQDYEGDDNNGFLEQTLKYRNWKRWAQLCDVTIPDLIAAYPEISSVDFEFYNALVDKKIATWIQVSNALHSCAIDDNVTGFDSLYYGIYKHSGRPLDANLIRDAVYGGSIGILSSVLNSQMWSKETLDDQYGIHDEIYFDAQQSHPITARELTRLLDAFRPRY